MDRLRRVLWSASSILGLVVLWWLGSLAFPAILPGIVSVADQLVVILTTPGAYGHMWYYHVWKTAEMIFVSLVISLVVGTVVGVALGTSDWLETSMSPWVYGWLAFPSLVVVFLVGVWFGFTPLAGYIGVPVVVTPFVVLNMWEGARNLDRDLEEMSAFFGASRYQTFMEVIIPQLVPFLFTSVRSALSIGWKITLLVEALLLTRGVGFMFKRSFDNYQLTAMMAWLVVFMVFLFIVEYGVIVPLHNYMTDWRPEVEGVQPAQ